MTSRRTDLTPNDTPRHPERSLSGVAGKTQSKDLLDPVIQTSEPGCRTRRDPSTRPGRLPLAPNDANRGEAL